MYRIIHSFLLVLAAVVAVTLLVAPQPAWTTTEAAPPLTVTPAGLSAPLGGGGGLGAVSLCSVTVTTTDLDPDCFDACNAELSQCLAAQTYPPDNRSCWSEYDLCENECVYGREVDPDNPGSPDRPPLPGSGGGTECEAPDDPGCGNLRNAPGPSGGTGPLDGAESPRRRPHLF